MNALHCSSPRRTTLAAAFVAAALLSVAATGHTQVTPDELGLSFVTSAEFKRTRPMIVLEPSIAIKSVLFNCRRSDGKRARMSTGKIREGATKKLIIKQGKGIFDYACKLSGRAKSGKFGPFEMDPFTIKVGQPPRFSLGEADVNEAKRTITLRCSEQKGRVELSVFGDDSEAIDEVEIAFDSPPGKPIVVKWTQLKGKVMGHFTLKVYDQVGFYSGLESITFVSIPHEDISFESGKWNIPKTELSKLTEPLTRIKKALAKVKGILPIKLYIGGYTDTVGSDADNMQLSRRRAASIAAWFSKQRIGAPILFQGFGERAAAVKTPDNTAEKRNRRAAYVLSKDMPPASRGFPARKWQQAR
jgi:outer membrane protein OmpA-like peptidoglycan-associated protein